jgi:hypothetical protein
MIRWKTALWRLLCSGLRGAASGAGIGFFFFLRLGFPKNAETTGFVCGLFRVAGFEFGISVEILRHMIQAVLKESRFGRNISFWIHRSFAPTKFRIELETEIEQVERAWDVRGTTDGLVTTVKRGRNARSNRPGAAE